MMIEKETTQAAIDTYLKKCISIALVGNESREDEINLHLYPEEVKHLLNKVEEHLNNR